MNRLLSSLFLSFLLVFVGAASFSQEHSFWRGGTTGEADPELERPAEKGKILPRDVILAVNGAEVDNPREFTRIISGTEAGSEVKLTIFRKGEFLQRSVTLTAKPRETEGREG